MIRLDTTPWARERLNAGERGRIAALAPSNAVVRLGYSNGFTCRVLVDRVVVGEAYHAPTPFAAFIQANPRKEEAA